MALISIILSLILDRMFRHMHDLRDLSWFEHYSREVSSLTHLSNAVAGIIMILLFPVICIALLQYYLSGLLFSVPYFLFGILALLFSLGPACLSSDVEAYLDARRLGDDDDALHYAGMLTDRAASISPDQQTNDVIRAIFHLANERIFSVLFWFVLLGPVGAVLYRLLTSIGKLDLEKKPIAELAMRLHAIMAWLPCRMLAAGYALTGHFDGALHAFRSRPHETDIHRANYDVLIATGLGALHGQEITDEISRIHAARDLVMRATVVWIAVLALLTLGGWLS